MNAPADITARLLSWQQCPQDRAREDALASAVYRHLHGLACARLRRESQAPVTATELVHEAWLSLVPPAQPLECRDAFFRLASQVMRNLLVDLARERLAAKRGAGAHPVSLSWLDGEAAFDDARLIDLDRALTRLGHAHPRPAQVVLYRCFGGLALEEIAAAAGASLATVKRDLRFAQAWLADALSMTTESAHGSTGS